MIEVFSKICRMRYIEKDIGERRINGGYGGGVEGW